MNLRCSLFNHDLIPGAQNYMSAISWCLNASPPVTRAPVIIFSILAPSQLPGKFISLLVLFTLTLHDWCIQSFDKLEKHSLAEAFIMDTGVCDCGMLTHSSIFQSLSSLEDVTSNFSITHFSRWPQRCDAICVDGLVSLPEATNTTFSILDSLPISCKNLVAAFAEPTCPIMNLTPERKQAD